jgi:hypothetical protein
MRKRKRGDIKRNWMERKNMRMSVFAVEKGES